MINQNVYYLLEFPSSACCIRHPFVQLIIGGEGRKYEDVWGAQLRLQSECNAAMHVLVALHRKTVKMSLLPPSGCQKNNAF